MWGSLYKYSCDKWALADNDVRGLVQSAAESLSHYLTRVNDLREVILQHGVKDERRLVIATLRGLRPEFGYLRPLLRNPEATLDGGHHSVSQGGGVQSSTWGGRLQG